MKFFKFAELYEADVRHRIKENTWATKEHIIQTKILPANVNKKNYIFILTFAITVPLEKD